jgi:hypothetical protein
MERDKVNDLQILERIRAGQPQCPSDLALDRLHSGELAGQAARELSSHIDGCNVCPQRMAERRAGFDAIPGADPRPLLAGIRRALHESGTAPSAKATPAASWLRFRSYFAAPVLAMAAAAAFAVIMVARQPGSDTPTVSTGQLEHTREKGGLGLHVYRLVNGQSESALSGAPFAAGDHLRFVVDLPSRGYVNILGVESSGNKYVAWPTAGEPTVVREAGPAQELPGAVLLDSSVGKETLYLVTCPETVGAPSERCTASATGELLTCPVGCERTPFVLDKRQR